MVKCYLDTVVVLYTNANSLGIFTAWSGGDILKIDINLTSAQTDTTIVLAVLMRYYSH